MFTDLAALDSVWEWKLSEDLHGAGSFGGYKAVVFSNAHSGHESNYVQEIDLTWCEPEKVREFARALLKVADRLESAQDSDNWDED